jgi:hypothetical protein
MRRILVNRARDKQRLKRGGGQHRVDLEQAELWYDVQGLDLLALDEALERLACGTVPLPALWLGAMEPPAQSPYLRLSRPFRALPVLLWSPSGS